MSSRRPGQSPRVKAHSLKVSGSSKKLKKKSSSRALMDTLESVASIDDYDHMGRPMDRSISSLAENRSVSQLMKSTNGQDVLQFQIQLAKVMDDTSILRSRLRTELEHRQVLESKITDLTEKLSEARRGLAETKGALNKVQAVASQLITKRDEREVQFQQALDQNSIYERRIAELEMHVSHLSLINEQSSNISVEKTIPSLNEKVKHLNEVLAEMKEKLFQSRKDFIRVQEEKESVEFMLESKKKRIQTLEEQVSRLSEGGLPADTLTSTRDSLLMSMLDMSRAQTARDSTSVGNGIMNSPVNMRGSTANSNNIAAAIASAVAGVNAPSTTDVSQFENKISNLESDKKSLEDRLFQIEKQFVEQQKMQLAQQQMQMQQQQKVQQQMQMQMQMQMAQQQAMMAQAGGQNPSSAVPVMRNSGSRASGLRLNPNGTLTPTSQPMVMSNATNSLVDATARLTAANTLSNAAPGAISAPAANFASAFAPSAPLASPNGMNMNVVNYAPNFNSNSNVNGYTSPVPAAMQPQASFPVVNSSNNYNPNNNSTHNNYNSNTPNNSYNNSNQPSNALPASNMVSNAPPQKALAEAEAQAVLQEILSSRERQRPRTVERPRSNDGVNVGSNGETEDVGTAPSSQRSRATTRESMDYKNANGEDSANRPVRQSTRSSTSENVERSQRGTSSRSSTRANPTLPVQNQTPNFHSQQQQSNSRASSPRNANDSVRRAIENTQVAYANNSLENKPFEANVRDVSTADAQPRPTMSRLASRYIKPGDDPEEAKVRLNEEKKSCKKKIMDWMKTFQQENGREPTKEEREAGAGVWYKDYRQISKVLKEVDGGNGRASLSMPDMDDD